MKLKFLEAETLESGILAVQSILHFETAENADITVRAEKLKTDKKELRVSVQAGSAVIAYSEPCAFFRGLSLLCQNGTADFSVQETGHFKTNGAMYDVSRNAVLKTETVKQLMTYMALMGLNTFMLYTEDTYTVEGRPYFGHMRGRYSAEEIREMEAFGENLGIELVPCMQVLAHLETALRWDAHKNLRDTHDILMADNEAVYGLIEDMFKSLANMYKTRKVHIGMDEAFYLGQGDYVSKHGYETRPDIFCRHLNRCCAIARKYGFQPMMWSDMFFRMVANSYSPDVEFSETVKQSVPRDVAQVYWRYNEKDEKIYKATIDKHREISDHIVFAGGIWSWSGPCPAYGMSVSASVPALSACIDRGVEDVLATVWHNGAECPLAFSLLGLALYAEMDYTGTFDLERIKARFTHLTGVDAEDILRLDIADHPGGANRERAMNPTRYLLYNDPLAGLFDKHAEGLETREFYEKIYADYQKRGMKQGFLFEAFEYYRAVVHVLERKADYGLRLKRAYDKKDIAALKDLYAESAEIENRIKHLHKVHRKSWLYYNKAFGFEVFDMIYGALESRFETLRFQLDQLFENPGYKIEELEEERLFFQHMEEGLHYTDARFGKIYSANVTSTVSRNVFVG